jgi:hypothetical protein
MGLSPLRGYISEKLRVYDTAAGPDEKYPKSTDGDIKMTDGGRNAPFFMVCDRNDS